MANPLAGIKDWIYHLGSISSARATEIGATNAGLVVIEQANTSVGYVPYTAAELNTMRGSSNKMIVSYISIGEAENYRPYWTANNLGTAAPAWLEAENPSWPGNLKVQYWNQDWKNIVFQQIDEMVAAGFNGLYLDIIDAFAYFEETVPNPVPPIDYRAEMVKFVGEIRAHAASALAGQSDPSRPFAIIGQNGIDLIETNPTYLSVIDGIGQEDLRFSYDNALGDSDFKTEQEDEYSYFRDLLQQAETAGVQVFGVEYMTAARQIENVATLNGLANDFDIDGIPLYLAEDRDLGSLYSQAAITPSINSFHLQYSAIDSAKVIASGLDLLITEGGSAANTDATPHVVTGSVLTDQELVDVKAAGTNVLAYINASVTDAARGYWDNAWTIAPANTAQAERDNPAYTLAANAPAWLKYDHDGAGANPAVRINNEFGIVVDFTSTEWRDIVTAQAVYLVQDKGYDGVFIDDVGRYFDMTPYVADGQPGRAQYLIDIGNLARSMMDLVNHVATAIRAVKSDAVIVVNGDPYMVSNAGLGNTAVNPTTTFLSNINAMLLESLSGMDGTRAYDNAALDRAAADVLSATTDILTLEFGGTDTQHYYYNQGAIDRGFVPGSSENNAYNTFAPKELGPTNENDTLLGTNGHDIMKGYAGDDVITGLGGNDTLDGGAGSDTAVFIGNFADYTIVTGAGNITTITDTMAGRDGVDSVVNIEFYKFADQTVAAGVTAIDWKTDVSSLELVAGIYQFFTGKAPTAAGFQYLISSTDNNADLNDPFYTAFNTENRYINFANNLGAFGEGKDAFVAKYGSLTLAQTIQSAFEEIISSAAVTGSGGDPAQSLSFFNNSISFYTAVANERVVSADISLDLAVKVVAVGSILNEAMKANLGLYSNAVDVIANEISTTGTSSHFGQDLLV